MRNRTMARIRSRARSNAIRRAKSKDQSRLGMTNEGNSTSYRVRAAKLRRRELRSSVRLAVAEAIVNLPGWHHACVRNFGTWREGYPSPSLAYTQNDRGYTSLLQFEYETYVSHVTFEGRPYLIQRDDEFLKEARFRGPLRTENSRVFYCEYYVLVRDRTRWWIRSLGLPSTMPEDQVRLIRAHTEGMFVQPTPVQTPTVPPAKKEKLYRPKVPRTCVPRGGYVKCSGRKYKLSRRDYDLLWNVTVALSVLGPRQDAYNTDSPIEACIRVLMNRLFGPVVPNTTFDMKCTKLASVYDVCLTHPSTESFAELARCYFSFGSHSVSFERNRPGIDRYRAITVNGLRHSAGVMRRAMVKEVVDSDLIPTFRAD